MIMVMMMKHYTINEAASLLKVTAQTLRNWDKTNKLKPTYIDENGYRYYSEDMIKNYYNQKQQLLEFPKMERSKVFRDTLYGNIVVEYQLIWDLIDTREVQRLRRIRQLSGVAMVFHTAEHSRFGHALGVYHIARRMVEEVKDLQKTLSEYEIIVLLCAALLHDVGHGPFSHAFEHVFKIRHEQITCQMIESPLTQINQVLKKYPGLATDIAGIIRHDGKYPLVESLISSQLDVDRLDYLNRDAQFTGATYGVVDVDRITRILCVREGKICYRAKGVHAIENYLMSRYHMYWQIYYHPKARSYEIILESIYARIKDLLIDNKKIDADVTSLKKVFFEHDLEAYIDIDDSYVNGIIKQLTKTKDLVLNDLCNAFMDRKLFAYYHIRFNDSDVTADAIVAEYNKNEILKKYYFKIDNVKQATYLSYLSTDKDLNVNNILILTEDEQILPLEAYSPIVAGLIQSGQKAERKIFYGRPKFKL